MPLCLCLKPSAVKLLITEWFPGGTCVTSVVSIICHLLWRILYKRALVSIECSRSILILLLERLSPSIKTSHLKWTLTRGVSSCPLADNKSADLSRIMGIIVYISRRNLLNLTSHPFFPRKTKARTSPSLPRSSARESEEKVEWIMHNV